jgi:hypothetical protein
MCCSAKSKDGKGVRSAHEGEGKNVKEALCSWCYASTVHYYIAETQNWLCDACTGRTIESPTTSDCMARLEGKGRRKVCAQTEPQLQHILARKRVSGKYWPRTALLIRSSVKCLAIQRHVSSGQGWPCAPLCASTRVGDNFFTRTIACAARPGLERARVMMTCPSSKRLG